MTDAIDPATLPIVTRFDARTRARQDAADLRERAEFFAFVASRQMDERRRDTATIDAVLAWARDPIPEGEAPEVFGLRASILWMGAVSTEPPIRPGATD